MTVLQWSRNLVSLGRSVCGLCQVGGWEVLIHFWMRGRGAVSVAEPSELKTRPAALVCRLLQWPLLLSGQAECSTPGLRWDLRATWRTTGRPRDGWSVAVADLPSLSVQEQFLVPDHTIKDISGASFAGFYYICFQKSAASIEGYYYHRSSEW